MNELKDHPRNIDKLLFYIRVRMPLELVDIIKEYIPRYRLAVLSKANYELYHKSIRAHIIPGQIENYIRDMARRDNIFVFNYIVKENYKRWLTIKKYKYNSTVFANYIYFLQNFCIENQSTNCRNAIEELLKTLGLSKNQHKKNVVINKRWTN